ncbi:MAG: extracellular solute-binding protein, partial [Firmicutes bacterium]|nr:extracellular solute-binding protein [Bacillota bacterium]
DLPFNKTYSAAASEMTSTDGTNYAFLDGVSMQLFFYNKEIFNQLGLEEPKDFAELIEVVKTLKENGYGGVAYGGADVGGEWLFNALVLKGGAENYKNFAEGIDSGEITSGIRDNEPFYTALKTMREYYKAGVLYENAETTKVVPSISLFAGKKTAIAMVPTGTIGVKKDYYPDIAEFGMFAVPSLVADPTAGAVGSQLNCIFSGSKNIEAAKTWLNWMALPENTSLYIAKAKIISSVAGVEIKPEDFPEAEMLLNLASDMSVLPILNFKNGELWTPNLVEMRRNILFGANTDVEKEIDKFEKFLQDLNLKDREIKK